MLEQLASLNGHTEDRIWHASWSRSGTYLATCGEDRTIRIWSSTTKNWTNDSITCIAVLENGQSRTLR
jgi:WD40 repeat protein